MQEVINKIEESVEFMVFNGDKKWFMYELVLAVNQALFEFSAYLTGDANTQLQTTIQQSKILNQSSSLLDKTLKEMKVGDLEPSVLVRKLHQDYLKNQNTALCDKMMEIVDFKERFNKQICELFRKKILMRENIQKIYTGTKDGQVYALRNPKEDMIKFKRVEKELTQYKKLEQLYFKDVADFEKTLADGHLLTNEGLSEVKNVIMFDGRNSLKILGDEFRKMRSGLSRLVRKLLKTREQIKHNNYIINKENSLEKVHQAYQELCGKNMVFEFDTNWPPFEANIKSLDLSDQNQVNKIYSSFYLLLEALDKYYQTEVDFANGFFDSIDRMATVDSKMLSSLGRFAKSEYKSDHRVLDQLLKNMATVRNNLRKITAKCFGPECSNCKDMKMVLESCNGFRNYA